MTDATALLRRIIASWDEETEEDFLLIMADVRDYLAAAPTPADARPCTCHPDDNPPIPCPRKYALSECRAAAPTPAQPVAWLVIGYDGGTKRFCVREDVAREVADRMTPDANARIEPLYRAASPARVDAENARDAARWRTLIARLTFTNDIELCLAYERAHSTGKTDLFVSRVAALRAAPGDTRRADPNAGRSFPDTDLGETDDDALRIWRAARSAKREQERKR